jgi:hypothetical protein
MLYTSFNPSLDSAWIWFYGPEAQTIAVGSTTGPASDPYFARLNWEEFSRDLMVANHFSHVIGVYNFGGCARQGFGVSSKSHEAPRTYPQSLVDRFKSSLFCRSDSNCLLLVNCVVEETSPSPESVEIMPSSDNNSNVAPAHMEKYKSPPFCGEDVEAFRVSIWHRSFRPEGAGPFPATAFRAVRQRVGR